MEGHCCFERGGSSRRCLHDGAAEVRSPEPEREKEREEEERETGRGEERKREGMRRRGGRRERERGEGRDSEEWGREKNYLNLTCLHKLTQFYPHHS